MLFSSIWRRGTKHDKSVETRRKRHANAPYRARMPRRLGAEPLERRQLMCVCPCVPDTGGGDDVPAIVEPAEDTTPLDTAPLAVADLYAMTGRQQLGANVLANDVYAQGAPLAVSLVDGPSHGTLNLGADGLFIYTPDRRFDGVDVFSYQFNDGQADSAAATVTINVARANDPPVAADDALSVDEDQVLSLDGPGVLANDTDANGETLHAELLSGPRNGTLVLGADGSLQYTPNAGFVGSDTFTYLANDGQADSDPATVDDRGQRGERRADGGRRQLHHAARPAAGGRARRRARQRPGCRRRSADGRPGQRSHERHARAQRRRLVPLHAERRLRGHRFASPTWPTTARPIPLRRPSPWWSTR